MIENAWYKNRKTSENIFVCGVALNDGFLEIYAMDGAGNGTVYLFGSEEHFLQKYKIVK